MEDMKINIALEDSRLIIKGASETIENEKWSKWRKRWNFKYFVRFF